MRSEAAASLVPGAPPFCASSGFLAAAADGGKPTNGSSAPQRAGETENGTERLATSVENVSYLAAFLFSLVQTLEKTDERYDGVEVHKMVVNTVTIAHISDQSASERATCS
jgi:hypothetical protein